MFCVCLREREGAPSCEECVTVRAVGQLGISCSGMIIMLELDPLKLMDPNNKSIDLSGSEYD